jgi:hypothetical protein
MRIGSMLLICALLAGCGCVDAGPDAASTCHGIGSVFESGRSGDTAGSLATGSSDTLPSHR